jgi:hypothetical protein
MNAKIDGFWNGKKEKLRHKFPNINENDVSFYEGKEKEMIEMLEFKLGKTKEELRNIITAL